MENNTTPQGAESTSEKNAGTEAERYPLIKDPIYRRCLEDVIRMCHAHIDSHGGPANFKSDPLIQLAKAGDLNADFMLRHFAGIFDHNSPLSSGQRQIVKNILTDAARKMAQMAQVAQEQAEKEAAPK